MPTGSSAILRRDVFSETVAWKANARIAKTKQVLDGLIRASRSRHELNVVVCAGFTKHIGGRPEGAGTYNSWDSSGCFVKRRLSAIAELDLCDNVML